MLANFTIPKGEQPAYYSTTVEDGKIIRHDGDPEHAVYSSVMDEISRRANLWHAWLERNVDNAHDEAGSVCDDVYSSNYSVMKQFMEGERSE